MNRRQFLMSMGFAALSISHQTQAALRFWPDAGIKNTCKSKLPDALLHHPLMKEIWGDINASNVWDCHVHLVGTGDAQTGTWFNPNMDSIWHPILKVQKHFYMDAACTDPKKVDVSYVNRLAEISQEMPTGFKSMLFAFDWMHDEQGNPLKDKSIFYVPNAYATTVAKQHANHFEWVASIHPYRPDALDALDEAKALGARAIKWLPSGMGIDPASKKCDAFYLKAAKLNIPIISHTGAESAVQGGEQSYGNPLKMRRALDHGVRVVLAHCASDGYDEDSDHGNKRVKSITLFERLMDTQDYQTLVYGEISALTLINHAWAIKTILARSDWHARLLNGSDYPLPGIFPLINTNQLISMDLLNKEYQPFLKTVKQYNPLMYDFAVKRLIASDGQRFAKSVFETRPFFEKET